MTLGEYIISGLLLVLNIIYGLLYAKGESYFKKKGENQATKEDIGEITEKIEQVKQQFSNLQHEHQTQYTFLHEKRFKVIEKMYKKVKRLHNASAALTQYFKAVREDFAKEEQERLNEYVAAYNDFIVYFNYKDIYFDKTVCTMIENLTKLYNTKVYEFHEPTRLKNLGVSGEGSKEYYKDAMKGASAASDYIREEMPKFLDTLKEELQKIIGIK